MEEIMAQIYAELSSGEPLGAEFERVWNENAEQLFELSR